MAQNWRSYSAFGFLSYLLWGEMRLKGLQVGFGQGWMLVLVTADFCLTFAQISIFSLVFYFWIPNPDPFFFAKPCQNSTPLASWHNYVSFLHLTHLRQFTLQPHGVWAFSSAPVSLAGNAGPAAGSIHLHSFISQKYKKQVLLKDSNSVFGVTPWDTCKRQHIEVPRCGSCCYCCYQISISPTFKGTMNVQNSVVGKPLA